MHSSIDNCQKQLKSIRKINVVLTKAPLTNCLQKVIFAIFSFNRVNDEAYTQTVNDEAFSGTHKTIFYPCQV